MAEEYVHNYIAKPASNVLGGRATCQLNQSPAQFRSLASGSDSDCWSADASDDVCESCPDDDGGDACGDSSHAGDVL